MSKRILIIYENINREYDNCLLLKAELQRRGYTVTLRYKTESICIFQDYELVITPNCYTLDNEKFYRYVFAGNRAPILSLQCEQVFTKDTYKKVKCYPDSDLSNVNFVAWGDEFYNKLLDIGINKNKIRITGAIQLDFCREDFNFFYFDKNEISKRYNLDIEKKWVLFISSLTMFPDSPYYKHFISETKDIDSFKKSTMLQVNTQIEILSWFEKLLCENKDYLIIYRRHPVEEPTKALKNLLSKYSTNFVDITDLSVKQWIKVSDFICNWFSTSAIEIAELNKPIIFLRPFHISKDSDYDFLSDVKICQNYNEFRDAILLNCENNFLKRDKYKYNYHFDGEPAYTKICDFVDEIISDSEHKTYYFERNYIFNRFVFLIKKLFIFKLIAKKVYKVLYAVFGFSIKNEKLRNKYCFSQLEYSTEFHKNVENLRKYDKISQYVNAR